MRERFIAFSSSPGSRRMIAYPKSWKIWKTATEQM